MTLVNRRDALLALAASCPWLAQAQGLAALPANGASPPWPTRPIRWVVAYPAGGGSDFLARQLAPVQWKAATLLKDLNNATALGAALQRPLPMASQAQQQLHAHCQAGHAQADLSSLILHYQPE